MASVPRRTDPGEQGYAFRLPIRTERDLRTYVRVAWGLEIPSRKVCHGHTTPWRAFADAYFARAPVCVWKGSRGLAGKTHLLGGLAVTEATTLETDVSVLGGSGAQSQRVLGSMDRFWSHPAAPRGLLKSAPAQMHTILRGSRGPDDKIKIDALLASQAQVRGGHPPRLRMDEIDEMDIKILNAAMGQAQRGHRNITPNVVLSSTHQYSFGTMTEILKRAVSKGWPVYEWCYRETLQPHGWLDPADVDDKRSMMTDSDWHSEVELQEPSPQDRYIVPEKVALMFDRGLGECEGSPAEGYIEFEPPLKNARYATGADWAKDVDWTVVVTLRVDCNPARVVAFQRDGRMPYPHLVALLARQVLRYGSACRHDQTGVGNGLADFLTVPAEGVILAGRTRYDLLTNYRDAIERGEIVSPHIAYMEGEHRLASRADVFLADKKHHLPDSICAGALALMAAEFSYQPAVW